MPVMNAELGIGYYYLIFSNATAMSLQPLLMCDKNRCGS